MKKNTVSFPKVVKIYQKYNIKKSIKDIQKAINFELSNLKLEEKIFFGDKIAITAGSRGITNFTEILSALVKKLKELGAIPFIVPAMGSHGHATSNGQEEVLAKLGITERTIGCPIKSSMEVVKIGTTKENLPIFLDKYAYEADHIVVVNRIKPHTEFKGSIESGLMKMMVIGLGKKRGAEEYHNFMVRNGYSNTIISVAREVLKLSPIIFGLGIVENQKKETAIIKAILPENIEETEKKLLIKAKEWMPKIPFKGIDLLVIDQMGKDISGSGMDPNIVQRHVARCANFPAKSNILRIFVRDLSPNSYGNADGIGLADFTTKKLVDKIDRNAMYMTCLTSNVPELGRIPIYFERDFDAIKNALNSCGLSRFKEAKIVRIKDTNHLQELEVSEALLEQVKFMNNIEILTEPYFMKFDKYGNLIDIFN